MNRITQRERFGESRLLDWIGGEASMADFIGGVKFTDGVNELRVTDEELKPPPPVQSNPQSSVAAKSRHFMIEHSCGMGYKMLEGYPEYCSARPDGI